MLLYDRYIYVYVLYKEIQTALALLFSGLKANIHQLIDYRDYIVYIYILIKVNLISTMNVAYVIKLTI